MFIDINNGCTTPGKQKVAESSPDDNCNTQPDVVGHEDKHQHVADCHLHHVQQRLNRVSHTHHVTTTITATSTVDTHTHSLTVNKHSNNNIINTISI